MKLESGIQNYAAICDNVWDPVEKKTRFNWFSHSFFSTPVFELSGCLLQHNNSVINFIDMVYTIKKITSIRVWRVM